MMAEGLAMSNTQKKCDPEPEASEDYGPLANFESIVDKFKAWKSDADSLQLKAEYDQVLKGLWWPVGSTFESYPKEQSPLIIERKFFPYHWLCSVKQMINLQAQPVVWNDGSVGVAAFETLLEQMDVFIISASLRDIKQVKKVGTGASFDVSLARALKNSNIPADRTGCSRPQWREGDWLAVKRGLFPMAPQQNMGIENDGQMYRAVLQEVRILNNYAIRQHPNFVRLLGVAWDEHTGSEGGIFVTPVLVQDYATHGHLLGFLRTKSLEGALTRELKIQLITGVAEGLQTLHNLGVVHGDVKCENILVSWDAAREAFVPKVSDFGFSIIKNSTHLSDYVDTPLKTLGATKRYLAPELWTPSETSSVRLSMSLAIRTDIYSFGFVLLTISLGGEDVFDAFTKLLVERGSIMIRADVDPEGEEIVDELISRTKTDSRMENYFLDGLKSLLSRRDPDFSREVYPVVSKMLTQNPEARLPDLSILKSHFSPALEPDALSGPSLDGLGISDRSTM
jgi:serine/threonine protein kinase